MDDFLFGLLEVTLCASAVIAVLLLLGKRLDRRFAPQWRYWAWLVLALRLAVPFNVTLPQAPVALELPRAEVRYERQIDPEPGLPQVSLRAPSAPLMAVDPGLASSPEELEEHGKGGPGCEVSVGVSLDIPLSRVLFALWAGGAGLCLLARLVSYARFQRRAGRWSRPVGTYRGLPVAECDLMATPLLMGLLRPVILVPPGGGENEFALLHEYTHAKRHDLWYKLLLVWVSALYWFNPLVWAFCRGAERDLEISCDAQVLRGRDDSYRRAYGQALLATLSAGRKPGSALTSAFSGSKRSLRRRFASLMDTVPRRPGRAALALLSAASLLGGTLVACGTAQEKTPLPDGAELLWELPAEDGVVRYENGEYGFTLDLPADAVKDLAAVTVRSDLTPEKGWSYAGSGRTAGVVTVPDDAEKIDGAMVSDDLETTAAAMIGDRVVFADRRLLEAGLTPEELDMGLTFQVVCGRKDMFPGTDQVENEDYWFAVQSGAMTRDWLDRIPGLTGRDREEILAAQALLAGAADTLKALERTAVPVPARDGGDLTDGVHRFALYGLVGTMSEDLSAQPEGLLVREMDGYDGERGYYYYYSYGLPGQADPPAVAPELYQITAAEDAVYRGFQHGLWATVLLSSSTPPWMALEVEMRDGQAVAVSRAEDCARRQKELAVVTGFEAETDVGPRLWYQTAEEGAEGLSLTGRGAALVKGNTLLTDGSGEARAPETFFQGLLGQAVELTWDNQSLTGCLSRDDLTAESRRFYTSRGSYDPERHTYTFTPLEADRAEGTWRDAGAGPVTLLVADGISLPEGMSDVRFVLESEPATTSAGDTLLELEARNGVICSARWLAAFQPAG